MPETMFRFVVVALLVVNVALSYITTRKQERQMDEFNAAVEALKASIKTKIDAETTQVLQAIEDLKAQVGTGLPKADVLSALTDLTTSIEDGIGKIFEPTPPVIDPDA